MWLCAFNVKHHFVEIKNADISKYILCLSPVYFALKNIYNQLEVGILANVNIIYIYKIW